MDKIINTYDVDLIEPCGQRKKYEVYEDGIHEVIETYDQYNQTMYGQSKLIMSKDAFIAAYNAYIKECE